MFGFRAEQRRAAYVAKLMKGFADRGMVANPFLILTPHPKVGYLPIPKAANTSIRIAMMPLVDAEAADLKRASKVHKFEPLNKQLAMEGLAELDKDAFVFTVVRHPAARLKSVWKNKIKSGKRFGPARSLGMSYHTDFDTFLEILASVPPELPNAHFRAQVHLLDAPLRDPRVQVYRMEDLPQLWPEISAKITDACGKSPSALEAFNVTRAGTDATFTERQQDIINYAHGPDFERFGYGWDAEGRPITLPRSE